MAVGNPLKNGPSGGNCSILDQQVMNDTEVHHSESVPLGQMRNLAETATDYSVGDLNNWMVPMGKVVSGRQQIKVLWLRPALHGWLISGVVSTWKSWSHL